MGNWNWILIERSDEDIIDTCCAPGIGRNNVIMRDEMGLALLVDVTKLE